MTKTFHKYKPLIPLDQFLTMAQEVERFTSTSGKRYIVTKVDQNEMFFLRLDAKGKKEWSMNLLKIYEAYSLLDDFATANFKPFVPIVHSPARGLLFYLELIA